MLLSVDADRCAGHGRCYTVARGLLQADDEGFVAIRGSSITVPEGAEAAARDAAGWCPERAIELTED